MTVLIVEDCKITSKILDLQLRKHRFKTLIKENGQEAIACLKNNPEIKLVIADIIMPEMDGLELLRNIRSDDTLNSIPVILCTCKDDLDTIQQAMGFGCTDYILKPINAGILLEKIKHVLKIENDYWEHLSKNNYNVNN